MGSYTKVVIRLTLKDNVPKPVVSMLRLLVCDTSDDWIDIQRPGLQHLSFDKPFFQADKWYSLFSDFTYHEGQCRKQWIEPLTIDTVSSVKHYDNEVPKFWEWIQEYVDRTKPYEVSCISNEIPMDNFPVKHSFLETDVESDEREALHKYICCECGTHTTSLLSECVVCDSTRICLTSVIVATAGNDYMKAFYTEENNND